MGKKKSKQNPVIMKITYIFTAIFLLMAGYFAYFEIFVGERIINNTYNKRQSAFEKIVVRGDIVSADGKVLATTVTDDSGEETRYYPFDNLFSHTIGITHHGKTGIELNYDYNLLGADVNIFEKITNEFADRKTQGNIVKTTLDTKIQKVAYDSLGQNNGAVIVLDPENGDIISLVSKPDFNPNTLLKEWDDIVEQEDNSCLVNRATNGLYTPGSTFKIITLLEYIREKRDYTKYAYTCNGFYEEDGIRVNCYNGHAHGYVDAFGSFAYSCNSSFINMGLDLNISSLKNTAEELLFNKKLPLDMDYKESSYTLDKTSSKFDVMQTVIGQGKTLVSPMHMALIASAIANDGILVRPRIVTKITNHNDFAVKKFGVKKYGELISKEEAQLLKTAMSETVRYGTGTRLKSDLYNAYGKTGTAEIDSSNLAHSWFVGFAENKDGKKIAVCVLLESMPPGSTPAVPVCRNIFDAYFSE